MMSKQSDYYQNEFSAIWSELPGYKTSWIDHLRLRAINGFTEQGFPHAKAEDWKYTDLSEVIEKPYSMVHSVPETISDKQINPLIPQIGNALTLVFVDGVFYQIAGDLELFSGVEIISLKEALRQKSAQIKPYLDKTDKSLSAFETLNTAFMSDGVCLTVEPNAVLTHPIHIVHIGGTGMQRASLNTRHLLVFGENAKATVIETYLSAGKNDDYLTNNVMRTVLKEGAELEWTRVQNEAESAFHFAVNRIDLHRNAHLRCHLFAFGARQSRENVKVNFEGQNSFCELNTLLMINGERQADIYTDMEHKIANSGSEENLKSVMDEKGKAVFRGRIKVYEDAQHTDARLNNSNLLLSETAEVNTMPQLEIFADDVSCNHGSSTGQLDDDQLFYLTSRGIDPTSAQGLLIYAFAHSVVEAIQSEAVAAYINQLLMSKLPTEKYVKELVK